MNSMCASCIYRDTHVCDDECRTSGSEMAEPTMFDDGSYDKCNHPEEYAEKIAELDAERERRNK